MERKRRTPKERKAAFRAKVNLEIRETGKDGVFAVGVHRRNIAEVDAMQLILKACEMIKSPQQDGREVA